LVFLFFYFLSLRLLLLGHLHLGLLGLLGSARLGGRHALCNLVLVPRRGGLHHVLLLSKARVGDAHLGNLALDEDVVGRRLALLLLAGSGALARRVGVYVLLLLGSILLLLLLGHLLLRLLGSARLGGRHALCNLVLVPRRGGLHHVLLLSKARVGDAHLGNLALDEDVVGRRLALLLLAGSGALARRVGVSVLLLLLGGRNLFLGCGLLLGCDGRDRLRCLRLALGIVFGRVSIGICRGIHILRSLGRSLLLGGLNQSLLGCQRRNLLPRHHLVGNANPHLHGVLNPNRPHVLVAADHDLANLLGLGTVAKALRGALLASEVVSNMVQANLVAGGESGRHFELRGVLFLCWL